MLLPSLAACVVPIRLDNPSMQFFGLRVPVELHHSQRVEQLLLGSACKKVGFENSSYCPPKRKAHEYDPSLRARSWAIKRLIAISCNNYGTAERRATRWHPRFHLISKS